MMRPLALLLVTVILAACSSAAAAPPPPAPPAPVEQRAAAQLEQSATAETEALSATSVEAPAAQAAELAPLGERAMATVRVLADEIGTRPASSGAERSAASYLAEQFEAIGYAVEIVPFSYSGRSGSGRSQNVVAVDPNEDRSLPLVVIGGHYDSVPAGPGANDNASGTATMLEVARQLALFPEPGVAVRYVAWGAEEVGLFGSRDFVTRLSPADRARLKVAISIDMIAVGAQPAFGGSEPWLTEAMARAESQGWRPENLSGFLRRLSDHASFLDAGLPGIMFHWVEDPYYHTALDVSRNVQVYSLDLMGAIAIELVRVAAR